MILCLVPWSLVRPSCRHPRGPMRQSRSTTHDESPKDLDPRLVSTGPPRVPGFVVVRLLLLYWSPSPPVTLCSFWGDYYTAPASDPVRTHCPLTRPFTVHELVRVSTRPVRPPDRPPSSHTREGLTFPLDGLPNVPRTVPQVRDSFVSGPATRPSSPGLRRCLQDVHNSRDLGPPLVSLPSLCHGLQGTSTAVTYPTPYSSFSSRRLVHEEFDS